MQETGLGGGKHGDNRIEAEREQWELDRKKQRLWGAVVKPWRTIRAGEGVCVCVCA